MKKKINYKYITQIMKHEQNFSNRKKKMVRVQLISEMNYLNTELNHHEVKKICGNQKPFKRY